jgi:ABC-type sugar transport system ATPase subunit
MDTTSPFLQVREISKAYPGVQALRQVSFDVQAGQVHALVGENGAGKSTLIKILAGAERPDPGGHILLQGQRYAPSSPRGALNAGISTIYQVFNLLPDRTIMHNILLGKEPGRGGVLDLQVMRADAQRALETLGAPHLEPEMLVGHLKVGEKQIVEIAKALLNRCRLMIMDEPTAALNQTEAAALFANIHRLRATGVTILYVSHRLDEIFELADCVTVLRDGEVISTRPIGETDRDTLIEEMIGRKLSSVFPDRVNRRGDEILRVEGLSSGTVLSDVSFSLHRGEVLAVAGLSGSGKSDLGRAIFGDLPIDSGAIYLRGKRLRHKPSHAIRSGLIYLPEDRKVDGILQDQSVRRNLTLSVLPRIAGRGGVITRARERRVAQAQVEALDIRITGLEQPVMTLSGGNQQKVVLGRCLAADPEVLVLMEPTQGIDVGVKFEIYRFITEQAAQGRAVLLISSELPEILGLAHRILVMRGGRIAAELEAQRTTQDEILRHALGEAAAAAAEHQ